MKQNKRVFIRHGAYIVTMQWVLLEVILEHLLILNKDVNAKQKGIKMSLKIDNYSEMQNMVYLFPTDALKSYHEFGTLKQPKFIFLQI